MNRGVLGAKGRLIAAFGKTATRLGGAYGEAAFLKTFAGFLAKQPTQTSGRLSMKYRGLQWSLDPRDSLQRRLLFAGVWELATLKVILKHLRPEDVFLDVGAHVGIFTLPVAQRLDPARGGRVIAVEPASDSFERLRYNLAINKLLDRVTPLQVALGRVREERNLRESEIDPNDLGLRSLFEKGQILETVQILSGPEVLEELQVQRVDMVKLDVEGAELEVLHGFESFFRVRPPRLFVIEVSSQRQSHAGHKPVELISFMEAHGYEGWRIRTRGVRKMNISDPKSDGNWVFARRRSSS